jgi:WD40 repeat protein/serine/threonine protein kinase
MTDPVNPTPPRSLQERLAAQGVLSPAQTLAVFCPLLQQTQALHLSGRLHGDIRAANVLLDDAGRPALTAPPEAIRLDPADTDTCPPELAEAERLLLPTLIESARAVLAGRGLTVDPRRLDVYALAALLVRQCTGLSVGPFLRSPVAAGRLPAPWRPVVEQALGFAADTRLHTAEQFQAALAAAGVPATPPRPEPDVTGPWQRHECPPAPPEQPLPFDRLGPYRLVRVLGRGGMGEVFLGHDDEHDQAVAVKVLRPHLARDPDLVRRFHREAGAAGRLGHPNVVPILFVGQDRGVHFYAMPYILGETLQARLDQDGRLAVEEALRVLEQCLLGLEALHDAGLVHRDLKPANVLLDPATGRALLTDFGLVKDLAASQAFTSTGVVLGTPGYLAPEQARDGAVDHRADLYGLGVVAYRMLSGALPFTADSPQALLLQQASAEPRPLAEAAPDLPEGLTPLVAGMMARDPADRYGSCGEALADLQRFRRGEAVVGPVDRLPLPEIPSEPRRPNRVVRFGLWLVMSDREARQVEAALQRVETMGEQYRQRQEQLLTRLNQTRKLHQGLAAEESARPPVAEVAAAADPGPAARGATGSEQRAVPPEAEAGEEGQAPGAPREELARVEEGLTRLARQRDTLKSRAGRLRPAGATRPVVRRLRGLAVRGLLLAAAGVCLSGLLLWLFSPPAPPAVITWELDGIVRWIDFTPDGKRVVVRIGEGLTILDAMKGMKRSQPGWGAATRQQMLYLVGHTAPVTSVAFSPDGRRIASAGVDQTVKVWDVQKGQQVLSLQGHTGYVYSVVFSPDGQRLASASFDRTVKVWDVQKGQQVLSLKGHTGPVYSVAFSPDGQRLASASDDQTVKVWDAHKGLEVLSLKGHTHWVTSVVFSPDGQRLASASWDRTVKVWDAHTGPLLRSLTGHTDRVTRVAFSPDGQRIVSGGKDGTLKVWDATEGRELLSFKGHPEEVLCVAFSPDGQRLVSGSWDKTVKVWDANNGQLVLSLKGHTDRVSSVAFSADGQRIASASGDQTVRVWDAHNGQQKFSVQGHTGYVTSVAFSPDGQRIASASSDKTVKVWDIQRGHELLTLRGHTGPVTRVAFSPDGQRIATVSEDKTVKIWGAQTGQEVLSIQTPGWVNSVVFSPDGKRIAGAGRNPSLKGNSGEVWVWDAQNGQQVLSLPEHTRGVASVAFSPDGQLIASASHDGTVKVWDAQTGQNLHESLPGGADVVAFAGGGRQIVGGSKTGLLTVWDAQTGHIISSFQGEKGDDFPGGYVNAVAISPDGMRLAIAGGGSDGKGELMVWTRVQGTLQDLLRVVWQW